MEQQFGFVATEYCGGASVPMDLVNCHQTAAGRFAALYRAGSSGQFAIKSFFQTNSEETAHDEYLLLARLNERGCPNVPRAYCYGTFADSTGAHPAFVMQYIDGRTLTDVIGGGFLADDAKRPFLDVADAASIALDIARALAGIAQVHVAQRDLSPNNIMIANRSLERPRRGDFELYVVDFGQSTLTTRSTITPGNKRLSTVPYGAPEVFGGAHARKRNREQCDVWSLGALVVSMVAGEYWPSQIQDLWNKEWLGKDDLERIAQAKRRPLDLVKRMEAVGRQPDDFAERLSDIVIACTNYNPSYRPNLRDVIKDLEGLLQVGSVAPVTPELSPVNESAAVHVPSPRKVEPKPKASAVQVPSPRKVEPAPVVVAVHAPSPRKAEPKPVVEVAVVRKGIADYTWIELKRIARAIAVAASDEEGLRIARKYNLVDAGGKLRGAKKSLTLADGTMTSVRILGFRHDSRASRGRAGISFEFADSPVRHQMNDRNTNVGGWGASEMRAWLNADFLASLPRDLRNLIVPVGKMSNNAGVVEREGDASVVTPTTDMLWLLSMSEVYGSLSGRTTNVPWSAATYDAEGTQYKLYADQGVSTTSYDYCRKGGASLWWWLRSPFAGDSRRFRRVRFVGVWLAGDADYGWGVSPGFCF